MIFVQFLGVIKCLNNPFCAKCHLAHTKNPHRKNFDGKWTCGKFTVSPKPFVRFNHLQGSINPSKLICLFRVERIYALYSNHTDHEIVPTDHEIVLSYTDNVYPYQCTRFRQ